jgi:hypothetical protein
VRVLLAISLLAACGENGPITPEIPPWDPTLPEARVMGDVRGLQRARGIVHLHSPYSHDACDGEPRDDNGVPNEPCLADLRAAVCTIHVDFAAFTDHDDTMADESFETLFSMRGSDTAVMKDGMQIASQMTCDDGHVVTFTVGGENDLMPIMLEQHVAGTVQERHDTYNGEDAIAAAAFRTAGGLSWIAHTESQPIQRLRDTADGIEVYNLHANIDPDIRKDFLGLDPSSAIADAAEFADTNPGHPEPDLAMLAFLDPNRPAIDKWHTLLGEGRHIPVTAGSDAHQNAIPIIFADNERGDSYRRVMRWFANIALVADPRDPLAVKAAMQAGRLFALFEILGTPEGFDVVAGATELGGSTTVGASLHVDIPRVRGLDPVLPIPTIHARVIRIAPGGTVTTVADVTDEPSIDLALDAVGAYRVEISIVPRHLGPYLGDLGTDLAEHELPWIYASPIYVE